jgi:hypothetical protein
MKTDGANPRRIPGSTPAKRPTSTTPGKTTTNSAVIPVHAKYVASLVVMPVSDLAGADRTCLKVRPEIFGGKKQTILSDRFRSSR